MAATSETRAPVLYMRVSRTRSRRPVSVEISGASRSNCMCSRVRCATATRSNLFEGIAKTRWATGSSNGSEAVAWRTNDRIAASRTLRVRALLRR
jgi:hypothetical protein